MHVLINVRLLCLLILSTCAQEGYSIWFVCMCVCVCVSVCVCVCVVTKQATSALMREGSHAVREQRGAVSCEACGKWFRSAGCAVHAQMYSA